ncbi:helix-turn-helix transcriptional regulator [Limnohabitans sp.]|uniref:helix-turn-helix domain-containing protein n=1 Tax=Limnohabitans sp. TaxID=1907725 RepID=UPI0038BADD5C
MSRGQWPQAEVTDYLLAALESARDVHSLSQLFMWVRGALWAVYPHEVLVFAVHDAQGRLSFSDAMHSEPLSDRIVNDLLDPSHGMLLRLQNFCRQYKLKHVLMNADGRNDAMIDEDMKKQWKKLKLGSIWCADAGDLAGNGSVCFALIGPQVTEHAVWMPLVEGALHLALMRVAASQRPLVASDDAWANANTYGLTVRQQEILKWIRQGKTNIEIAAIVNLSPFTVKNHLKIIFQKLAVSNRVQAAAHQ